jgi:hypothetical protein
MTQLLSCNPLVTPPGYFVTQGMSHVEVVPPSSKQDRTHLESKAQSLSPPSLFALKQVVVCEQQFLPKQSSHCALPLENCPLPGPRIAHAPSPPASGAA